MRTKNGAARNLLAGCLMIVGALATFAYASLAPAPATRTSNVTTTYHGVSVSDPYRWLEDGDSPQVQEWSAAQNDRARHYLDALPYRQAIFDRLMKEAAATSSSYGSLYAAGGKVFALYSQPPKQQPMIAVLGADLEPAHARVIVDPNAMDPSGTTAIDWFVPSPDGRLLAVSLSKNGSEDGSVHLFDVDSGRERGEVIPRAQFPTAGGSLAWLADSKSFWYTRYPGPDRPAEEQHFYQRIYRHRLGDDPAHDAYVLGKDFPKIAEVALNGRESSKYVIASVANGDGGQYAHYLLDQSGHVTQITHFEDGIVAAALGPDDAVYLISRKDAPRGKLLRLAVSDPALAHAQVLVPESDAVMQPAGEFGGQPVVATRDAIYLRELVGGPSRVAIYDHEGNSRGELPLPPVASVQQVVPLGDHVLAYSVETYLTPPSYSRYVETTRTAAPTQLAETSPVSFADAEVVREFATSKDGTRVPLNIVRRRGTALNGANPVLLYGYGGYGVSQVPRFLGSTIRLWLDAGGIYVVANLRSGGEFGEEWHAQGALTHKQNVFDDFIAAARHLIARHYTSPAHLAIMGGSNGGLLMGAVLTQHPELFRAVVSRVGIYDMLRVELDPNGAFNTTEFGSTRDPQQFKALYAYSPYHHVVDGTRYPAIFMSTGAHDSRVNPMHSRKMIARLQAANASDHPILLAVESHAGHGIGSALSIRIGQSADIYAFLFDQLGMRL